jgi:hypothetical protein
MPSLKLRALATGALTLLTLMLGVDRAHAIVEQSDGSVVPFQNAPTCPGATDQCVQTALNIGEGFAANAANNPLKAVFDAGTQPEVFSVPLKNGVYGNVKFDDLQEGAGFENTFGWYNASDPSKLYPVTPCADEPGSSRTVNFQTEFAAGRYLGGFIGFFLITPENQPVANNCGAIGDVGHLYYTEQARNGDGNYVHYLIYQSKKDPLKYYFGFEDLFRGGDNDFDDMFMGVTGLLAPCVPSPEVCDGKDNNCDGLIDNMPVDAGGQCGLSNVGECKYGVLQCQAGALVCVGAVGPTPEVCDLKDNDCNGVIDDNPMGVGQSCGLNVGECKPGATQCLGGVLVCVGGKGPSLEVCDLKDNDCNGTVDDNTTDTGGPCGSNVGECTPGVLTCSAGMVTCVGGNGPTPEICDSKDNDCNGAIDDGDPGSGAMCGSDVGVCKPGIEHCLGGKLTCVGGIGPSPEICDGLDNDCDGTGDNLVSCPDGSQCIMGQCAAPCQGGEFPCPGGQICKNGFCVLGSCDDITCPKGQMCTQGVCVPDTGMGGGGAGGAPSTSSSSSSGSPTSTSTSTSSGESKNNWGLATGGGGALCAFGATGDARWGFLLIAIAALGVARRRSA